ncbi:MAG: hypothetical protein ACREQ5_00190 [Candidatus Dormibacteria bacterium]
MTQPLTLDKIQAITDPLAQIEAVKQYDHQISKAQAAAHRIRDDAILRLLANDTPTAVARLICMSVSHVKLVRAVGDRT